MCISAHITADWSVASCCTNAPKTVAEITTCSDHKSIDGKLWICSSCKVDIYNGLIPKMSTANKVGFPPQPPELQIHPLEATLISPLLPFMVIRSLPICGQTIFGQKQIIGNVVNVPNNIASTAKQLPQGLGEMGTIGIDLKWK